MRSADGGKVELLLHEQFADFIGFAKHEGTTLFVPTATGKVAICCNTSHRTVYYGHYYTHWQQFLEIM